MNINNLKEGQTIKNYKELCELLNIKVSSGNSKIKQLEDLKMYCNYHKQGNKFVIDEMFNIPMITIDKIIKSKNNKYIKPLSNIILEYLYNKPNELREIPISKFFTLLGITNKNYNSANKYRKELSQIYDIKLASIYYFYSNTRLEFKNIIERCLNNLQNRRVLNWYKVIMVIDKDNGIYKADEETEKLIINTEKETLEYLNVNNMYELMQNKKLVKEFNEIVFKETDLNYFYAYDLVIGDKAIQIEYKKVISDKKELNNLIISRTEHIFSKDKYQNFIEDYKQLNDLLLSINCKIDMFEQLKSLHENNLFNYYNDMNNNDDMLVSAYEKHKSNMNKIRDKYLDKYNIVD